MTGRASKAGASDAHRDAAQPPPPGSRAPSFSVPALLNSLPRVLLRFGGLFGSCFRRWRAYRANVPHLALPDALSQSFP